MFHFYVRVMTALMVTFGLSASIVHAKVDASEPLAPIVSSEAAVALSENELAEVEGAYIIGTTYKPSLNQWKNYGQLSYIVSISPIFNIGNGTRNEMARLRNEWISYAYYPQNSRGQVIACCGTPYCM